MKQKHPNSEPPSLWVYCPSPMKESLAQSFSDSMQVPIVTYAQLNNTRDDHSVVVFDTDGIHLDVYLNKQHMKIKVDFVEGRAAYRRLHGGGRGQPIAKAIGVGKKFFPQVVDCTAGLGSDAFVLASLGCRVYMNERNLLSATLLRDGLERAIQFSEEEGDDELGDVLNRMSLTNGDSIENIRSLNDECEVIYLDPMFPLRKKNAAVKKEMQAFHHYVGTDEDSDALLAPAIDKSKYRVVVKRPSIAPFLDGKEPTYQLKGKSTRFDIYTKKAMPS